MAETKEYKDSELNDILVDQAQVEAEEYDDMEDYDDYDDYLDDELNDTDMWDNATGGKTNISSLFSGKRY